DKTSSVHFMRFELSENMISALKNNESLSVGIDHAKYTHVIEPLSESIRESLVADLQ
ncbi:MAG: DUF3501 family protein, partial [Gammaproteobacteria bacterium]